MKLKALRNILVKGEHVGEGELFDTDPDTANALLTTRKVRIATDLKKEEAAAKKAAKEEAAKKAADEAEEKAKEEADSEAQKKEAEAAAKVGQE